MSKKVSPNGHRPMKVTDQKGAGAGASTVSSFEAAGVKPAQSHKPSAQSPTPQAGGDNSSKK